MTVTDGWNAEKIVLIGSFKKSDFFLENAPNNPRRYKSQSSSLKASVFNELQIQNLISNLLFAKCLHQRDKNVNRNPFR